MPPLIYLEDSCDEEDNPSESPTDPPSTEPTPELVPPIKKPTEEPTLETYSDDPSETSAPTGGCYMGHIPPKDILRYQIGSDPPILAALEDRTKEDT